MSDFEDRLAALDPAAGASYRHRDLDALISRITSQPVARKRRRWHTIELKLAGTLIAGALVTAGSLAIVQGAGTALPVLALKSPSAAQTFKGAVHSAAGAMQVYERFDFTAGSGLGAAVPTNLSYELKIPSSPASEAARVASIFGVSGAPVNASGDGLDWTVTGSSGHALDYASAGIPQWTFSTTSLTSSTGYFPSRTTLAADVQRYLTRLGYGYTLSAPSFGTTTSSATSSATSAPGSTSTEDVTYSVDVDGSSTDQYVSFSVDANNNVVSASGPAFSVATTSNYPLQSPAAGVDALNVEQQGRFPATSPATSAGGSTNTTPSGPPVVNVILDADTITLETYQLTDGSLWLLPVYDYSGTSVGVDGSLSTGTWYELAVDPSYVHVSGPGSSRGVVNY